MRVRDWMTPRVIGVGPEESVFEAKRRLHEHDIRHLPVIEAGRLVGVVTHRDLLGASLHIAQTIAEPNRYLGELRRARVKDYMAHPPLFVGPSDPVEKAARFMRDRKIGCLPVVENESVVGMLTETDLFDALVRSLGLEHGERSAVFELDAADPLREIVDWLLASDLALTSVVTYQPRNEAGGAKILARATRRARTSRS